MKQDDGGREFCLFLPWFSVCLRGDVDLPYQAEM